MPWMTAALVRAAARPDSPEGAGDASAATVLFLHPAPLLPVSSHRDPTCPTLCDVFGMLSSRSFCCPGPTSPLQSYRMPTAALPAPTQLRHVGRDVRVWGGCVFSCGRFTSQMVSLTPQDVTQGWTCPCAFVSHMDVYVAHEQMSPPTRMSLFPGCPHAGFPHCGCPSGQMIP